MTPLVALAAIGAGIGIVIATTLAGYGLYRLFRWSWSRQNGNRRKTRLIVGTSAVLALSGFLGVTVKDDILEYPCVQAVQGELDYYDANPMPAGADIHVALEHNAVTLTHMIAGLQEAVCPDDVEAMITHWTGEASALVTAYKEEDLYSIMQWRGQVADDLFAILDRLHIKWGAR